MTNTERDSKTERIIILQNGGGWATNIGNSFIDLGCRSCLENAAFKAGIEADIHLTSSFGRWVFYHLDRGIKGYVLKEPGETKNFFNLQEHVNVDYVVLWGSFLSEHWFQLHGKILTKLSQRGVKIIVNGGGVGEDAYSEEKIQKTRKYFKALNPHIFVSRDQKTFDSFADLAEYSYDGIDCAFWVKEAYNPLKLDLPEYLVLNFDKQPEPEVLRTDKGKLIIRVHHAIWHGFPLSQIFRMKKNYYGKRDTIVSELPYDYLNLYANTCATYSDRVHACVATLAYGNPARLFGNPLRAVLFEKVGASEITNRMTKPDLEKIETEKQKQRDFLSKVLRDSSSAKLQKR